ncbi:MAG: hypothetical protein WAP52_02775 [Candidatus Sungiibacteriota bacterium]
MNVLMPQILKRFFRHLGFGFDLSFGFWHWDFQQGKTAGFTLLETVVALTVILAAVVGPVSLITRGLFSFSFSKNKVIAANLAQEGLEIMRLVRENNIMCDNLNGPAVWQWNRDPDGMPMHRLQAGVDMQSLMAIRTAPCVTIVTPKISISCSDPLLFESAIQSPNAGTYGYASGSGTIFSRCVEITSPPDNPDNDIPASDQMDIVATVTWNEHGNDRSMKLQERLYNWR